MSDRHQPLRKPVIHRSKSGGSIHSSDDDIHEYRPGSIPPYRRPTTTSTSNNSQRPPRDRTYYATGGPEKDRPGRTSTGRANLAPTDDSRDYRRRSASGVPGREDTSASQSGGRGRGRGGLEVPQTGTRPRAASTGDHYDEYIFGAEAPHCHSDNDSPDSDTYHKQLVKVRRGDPLPSAESLLRKYVPQAVTCPIRDSDGNQTGLMDFWSCGDETCTDCLFPYKESDFGQGLVPDARVEPRPKVALWKVFADDPNALSIWAQRSLTTHQGLALHAPRSERQSQEVQAYFRSRRRKAIEDYNKTSDAFHRHNQETGKFYADCAAVISTCGGELAKGIRTVSELVNTSFEGVDIALQSAANARDPSPAVKALQKVFTALGQARSTLDGMPPRAIIIDEASKITHCTTAQSEMSALLEDEAYEEGYQRAKAKYATHLVPHSRRGSRDTSSRNNSVRGPSSQDRPSRSSGDRDERNSGSGSGTRDASRYR